MGFLNGLKVYLSGPIDRVKDGGIGWRKEISPHLIKLGMKVIDPTSKPKYLKELIGITDDRSELEHINELKKRNHWGKVENIIKKIIHVDLRGVDACDVLICNVPSDVVMCGTIHEIVVADIEKKPILAICEHGKQKIAGWLIGLIGHKNIYTTIDSLINRLKRINSGEANVDKTRWLLWG